jgi:hypothetical protein
MNPRISPDLCKACALILAMAPVSMHGEEAVEKPAAPAAGRVADTPFKARLDAREYEKRVARLDQGRLDPKAVETSKLPDFGVVVNDAAEGSPAAKAGLVKGWIIDEYNGEDYWSHHQGMQAQADNNDERREIEAVSPAGERKTFQFGPGRLGINTSNAHRPEQELLRNLPRGAWDRDMLVTAQAWHLGDHELIETALARAVEKGMPANSYSDFYGAALALDRGDKVEARRLLEAVLKAVGKDGEVPRFYRSGIRTLALGLGDYALLRKAVAEVKDFNLEIQEEMIPAWEKWSATASKESLVSRAMPKAGADLLAGVVTVDDGWGKFYRIDDPAGLRDGTHFAAKMPPDYDDYCFAPEKPVKDVIWEIRGGYGDIEPPRTFHEIAFYLVDLKKRKQAAERMHYWIPKWVVAGLRLRNDVKDGRVLHLSAGINEIEIPTQRALPRLNGGQVGELLKQIREGKAKAVKEREGGFVIQLIRMGNEAEVVINGVPYLRLPVDPSVGELGCVIHSTGMAVAVDGMTLRELEGE